MSTSSNQVSKNPGRARLQLFFAALIIACLVVATVMAAAGKRPAPASDTRHGEGSLDHTTAASPAHVGGDPPGAEEVEAELIALTPNGCEPGEITRARGRFLLAVENRTGAEITTLEVSRENGSQWLVTLGGRRRKLSWRQVIDPPPGRYVLTTSEYPGLVCRLTITN
jgi:hypothetical protein